MEEVKGIRRVEKPLEQKIDDFGVGSRVLDTIDKHQKDVHKLVALFKEKELAAEISPKIEEIEGLPQDEKESLLALLGKLNASISSLTHSAGRDGGEQWKRRFEHEYMAVDNELKDNGSKKILERLLKLVAIYIETEKNSNSTGSSIHLQQKFIDELASAYLLAGEEKEANLLLNPFNLKSGDKFYVSPDGINIKEKVMGEVMIDTKDSVVDIDGDTLPLSEVNQDLSLGRYMLKDGSNCFGGVKSPLEDFKDGDTVSLGFTDPLNGKSYFDVRYMGSNEGELENLYGKSYIKLIPGVIKIKYDYKGQNVEVPLRSVTLPEKDK